MDAPRAIGGVQPGDIDEFVATVLDGAAKGAAIVRSAGIGIHCNTAPVMRREQPGHQMRRGMVVKIARQIADAKRPAIAAAMRVESDIPARDPRR